MKNHLFIGLGGQGGRTLAELRKVFEQRGKDADQLRNTGHQWGYCYIDSSKDVLDSTGLWTYFGKNLSLDPADFIYLKDTGQSLNPRALALLPEISPWIGNVGKLEQFLEGSQGIPGANQRRRVGRLLYANNAARIRDAISQEKIEAFTKKQNECAIHVFATLAGGTGSGSVVDFVTMLRTVYPSSAVDGGFPIFLYLYVTDADCQGAQVGYFHSNQLAALRDLNALACGRFRPTLLNGRGRSEFAENEPLTQVILSTGCNNSNQTLSIEDQHQIIAEAAFERIFAYCTGHLDPKLRKALTGEDLLPSYQGEPSRGLLRSFRFGSIGMKRWEVPTGKIRELLAKDLCVGSFRQMLYNHWSDNDGFLATEDTSPLNRGRLSETVASAINKALIENDSLDKLIGELSTGFNRVHAGEKKKGFNGGDLSDYETALQGHYETRFHEQGVESLFSQFKESREKRVESLFSEIRESIKAAWTNPVAPIGLACIPGELDKIRSYVTSRIAATGEDGPAGDSALLQRMEARKGEWGKMTFLSRPLKQVALAESHKSDFLKRCSRDLRNRVHREDRETLTLLVGKLATLGSDYLRCVGKLKKWHDSVAKRRDELRGYLRDNDQSNKIEISQDDLDVYLDHQSRAKEIVRGSSADLLDKAILRTLGNRPLDALGELSDDDETRFWNWVDEAVYGRIDPTHDKIVLDNRLSSVLNSGLLDILQRRQRSDADGFKRELHEFIDSATCTALLDGGQFQPNSLRGDNNMPPMPKKALLVGLPRGHAFSAELRDMIRPLMSAGNQTEQGLYEHDDPTQIRLFFGASWMAARFAKVVQGLHNRYEDAIRNDNEGDVAYFTNIDESGERNERPSLLLPTPEESKSSLRAALWLGQRIQDESGQKLIQVADDARVVVIHRDADGGLRPETVGQSMQAVEGSANLPTINKVVDLVAGAVAVLGPDQRERLRNELKQEEDEKVQRLGVTSSEYSIWADDRKKISQTLSQ